MIIQEKLDKLIEICDAEEELYNACENDASDSFHFCRNFHENRILLFKCADIVANAVGAELTVAISDNGSKRRSFIYCDHEFFDWVDIPLEGEYES